MLDYYPIDLRSDTVTKPSEAMRKAMAEAIVGDDVFAEDPTVIRLQERVAEILGKEAALFVPSGVMGNQVALAALTRRGDEVVLDEHAHILNHESAAPAVISGIQLKPLPGSRGILSVAQVAEAVNPDANAYAPPASVIALENTHNRGGGSIYPLETMQGIREVASRNGLKVHLDGARLWNAAAATGIPESRYAEFADTVSVCFSKGLGAPVGSAIAGTHEFIQHAHRIRKLLGGGMRQAGIIAAGALFALEYNRARLTDDHEKAKRLAEILSECANLSLDSAPETNILYVSLKSAKITASELVKRCAADGVLFFADGGKYRFRLVTHLDIPFEAVEPAAHIIVKHAES